MSDVHDYPSRLSDPNSRKMGTFSYIPTLTSDELYKQLEYIVGQGWSPAVEHTEPENATGNYWYMWKLPMFGETDIKAVLDEVEQCKKGNPDNHVRVVGYDRYKQTQGTAFMVHRAEIKV
jgi:ribulose-bisphosphate carboxylase small chain